MGFPLYIVKEIPFVDLARPMVARFVLTLFPSRYIQYSDPTLMTQGPRMNRAPHPEDGWLSTAVDLFVHVVPSGEVA